MPQLGPGIQAHVCVHDYESNVQCFGVITTEHTSQGQLLNILKSQVIFFSSRATETCDEVESLRPPRFFNEDGVIRPYRLRDGTGNQMLQVGEEISYKLRLI